MPYVITQGCCNDASCIAVCPVDCIHPTPQEQGFVDAEMLYIDPDSCIDCGACVPECPVDAIKADDDLAEVDLRYLEINADYYKLHPVTAGTPPLASTPPGPHNGELLRVAIVGSGPAACYAAGELLTHAGVQVDMFERLPTPWGLVRAGVAPDHQSTKRVSEVFESMTAKPGFRMYLNVEIGTDLSHQDLLQHHHAVVYAHGAARQHRLDIPGADLPGSVAASAFVNWYNGHPDYSDLTFDLSTERAVIIGNGNVALDVARMLTMDVEVLSTSDIADHAVKALRDSNIREVVVVGRRGPAQAAFTASELLALTHLAGVDVVVDPDDLVGDDATSTGHDGAEIAAPTRLKATLLTELAHRKPRPGSRRIVLQFLASPTAVIGDGRATGVRLVRNTLSRDAGGTLRARPTDDEQSLEAGLVLHSVGYHGTEVDGVPFDGARGIIPNDGGRVIDPDSAVSVAGVYTTGWIRRGSNGVIGTNKRCAREVVGHVLEDFAAGRLGTPMAGRHELGQLLRERQPQTFGIDGWQAIDSVEQERGAAQGRVRAKVVDLKEMLAIACNGG